jgi:aerobic carbon-monoxide dehydrogenase medium subunit
MVPRPFQYFAPTSLAEAAALLRREGGDAKVLAGGMSLIPVMKLRLAGPSSIVDINRIRGLDYIREAGGRLLIGSMTRHHAIETSDLLRMKARLLSETAGLVGDPQVRNRGTIGGSLVHCDPSGDWGAALLAMRGSVRAVGSSGERSIPVDDFLVDTFLSAIGQDEILVEVSVPVPPPRSGGAYQKLERRAGDFPTAAVAAQVSLDADGACASVGVGLAALGPKNLRARGAEEALLGKKVTDEAIEEAAAAAGEDSQPTNDPLRGSSDYKREMAAVLTKRALAQAVKRARGREGK